MSLVIETGVGVRSANAYVNESYVTTYLTTRGRETENSWSTATTAVKEAAIVSATDYIDKRFGSRFKGSPKTTFEEELATATITFAGLPLDSETLILGDETYTFVSSLSGSAFEVLIGASAASAADNLAAAIELSTGAGTFYGLGTAQSRHATATSLAGVVSLVASAPGVYGALTVLTTSATNVTVTAFTGGRDGGVQPLSWPRSYAYDKFGNLITGIPANLKNAVSEYAVRAVASTLLPDPTSDVFGGRINKRLEKVGPIEEAYEYDLGTGGTVIFTSYPSADKLLSPLLLGSSGGVIRG